MTASLRSIVSMIRNSPNAASGPGVSSGLSSNAGVRGSLLSISAIGSPTVRKWRTRRAFRRSSVWRQGSGPTSLACQRVLSRPGRRAPMAISTLDSVIFADMFGTAAMREIFGDEAFLARCVEVEAALARAQGKLGVIPAEAANAITHAAHALGGGREALDLARLKRETETVGYPILPLVRQLAQLADGAGRYVHWGATTQDIMDKGGGLADRGGPR